MRILIHDYGRYAFIGQLAQCLAERGHQVLYLYSAADTARSSVSATQNQTPGLQVLGIVHSRTLVKEALFSRWKIERKHGRCLAAEVDRFKPDVVVSANTPLESQAQLTKRCRARRITQIYWVQDLLGVGIRKILARKSPVVGAILGWHYERMERRLLRQSDGLVLISPDFEPYIESIGLWHGKKHVIPNWAPLDQHPVAPKGNAWAEEHGLKDKFCFLYSGTLGMKHNPELLTKLAEHYRDDEHVAIVVVSEGSAAKWLRQEVYWRGLTNMHILPFQPFERLIEVLATADVLIALLGADAGAFSVPSKVLTYLCAARPVILAVPPENLAARIIQESEAGLVVASNNTAKFLKSADNLRSNEILRKKMGANGRQYAERNFDIQAITDRFEAVLEPCRGMSVA